MDGPAASPYLPAGLAQGLPYPETPWNLSKSLYQKLRLTEADVKKKIVCKTRLITEQEKAEYDFVTKMFMHTKPPNYHIGEIYAIHNRNTTEGFQNYLEKSERQARKEQYRLRLDTTDPLYQHQVEVIQEWRAVCNSAFPTIKVFIGAKKREYPLSQTRVLPGWHGTSAEVIKSICEEGFEFFGKHHLLDSNAPMGSSKNTDVGYYGSGIYSTNSAEYAAKYGKHKNKCLVLGLFSMRTPYPIVSDNNYHKECQAMKRLKGQGGFDKCNAHFIPVIPKDPTNPKCVDYYPCYRGDKASWFELVVFNSVQALPRYYVFLARDEPKELTFQALGDGLNIKGICKNGACSLNEKEFVIKKGVGKYGIGELLSTSVCPCCKQQDRNSVFTGIIFKSCAYNFSGVDNDGNKNDGSNAKLANTFELSTMGWKRLTVETKPSKS